jgi:8-oxo-dGTP diphosphatase
LSEKWAENCIKHSDREYPQRPIPAVHVVLLRGPQVLLVQRANPPSQGRWSVPGGVIELGETIRQAAQRELLEECNVEIEVDSIFDVVDNIIRNEKGQVRFHFVLVCLLARYVRGQARASSDALALRWVAFEHLDALDLHEIARKATRKALTIAKKREG